MTNEIKPTDPFNGLEQTKQDDKESGLTGMSDGKDNERYQALFLGGGETVK